MITFDRERYCFKYIFYFAVFFRFFPTQDDRMKPSRRPSSNLPQPRASFREPKKKTLAAASELGPIICTTTIKNCARPGWVVLKRREEYDASIKDEAKVRACAPLCDVYQVARRLPSEKDVL